MTDVKAGLQEQKVVMDERHTEVTKALEKQSEAILLLQSIHASQIKMNGALQKALCVLYRYGMNTLFGTLTAAPFVANGSDYVMICPRLLSGLCQAFYGEGAVTIIELTKCLKSLISSPLSMSRSDKTKMTGSILPMRPDQRHIVHCILTEEFVTIMKHVGEAYEAHIEQLPDAKDIVTDEGSGIGFGCWSKPPPRYRTTSAGPTLPVWLETCSEDVLTTQAMIRYRRCIGAEEDDDMSHFSCITLLSDAQEKKKHKKRKSKK